MRKLSIIILSLFIIASCSSNQDITTETKNTKNNITDSQNDSKSITNKSNKAFNTVEVDNINFAFDSYQLSESDQNNLKPLVKFLKANDQLTITISGHCDSRGTKDYNLILGEKRALAVKNFLKAQNVAAERIDTISFGEEKPLKSGIDITSYQANRRAEIVFN